MNFHSSHIQKRLNELLSQYNVLSEKIEKLRVELAIQADVAHKFQLEKQIEQSEKERESLQQEILSLEKEYGKFSPIIKVKHDLPQPTYYEFIGFQEEFESLLKFLSPQSGVSIISIDGPGGVGKSALAQRIAYHYLDNYDNLIGSERFDAIIWISAKPYILTADGVMPRSNVAKTLRDIYVTISITLNREDITKAPIEEQDDLVRNALAQQRTLLILDNLDDIDDDKVSAFIREVPSPTKVIVTSVKRLRFDFSIHLKGLSDSDGVALINTECERNQIKLEHTYAIQLLSLTGNIPLAIVWSIAQIGYGFDVSYILEQLRTPTGEIAKFCLEKLINSIYQKDIYVILKSLSLFEGDASKSSVLQICGLSNSVGDKGLVELEKLSLINKNWDRYTLLPFTKIYLRSRLDLSSDNQIMTRWVNWAIVLLQKNSPLGIIHSVQSEIASEYENIIGIIDWCNQHQDWENLTILSSHICLFLYYRGLWQELLEIVDIGSRSCKLIDDNYSLAWLNLYAILVYIYRRELEQAEELLAETQIIINGLPSVSSELHESLEYRKITLQRRKKQPVSIEDCESQLLLARKSNDPSRIVSALSSLADKYFEEGDIIKSDGYLIESLQIAQGAKIYTLVARVLCNIARKYRSRGSLLFAKEKIEQALSVLTDVVTSVTSAYVALEAAYIHKDLNDSVNMKRYADMAYSIFLRLGMTAEAQRCETLLKSDIEPSK